MGKYFYGETSFFRAKNLSVNTWRSGPDICSLICGYNLAKIVWPGECNALGFSAPSACLWDVLSHNWGKKIGNYIPILYA